MGSRGRGAVLAAMFVAPASAFGALSVTRAELSGERLRAEGRGANPQAAVRIDGGAAFGSPVQIC